MRLAVVGDDAKPVTKESARQDVGEKGKSVGTEKSQSGQAVHHRHLAFCCLRSGAVWSVAHGRETISNHSSCMFGCGWTTGLPLLLSRSEWGSHTTLPSKRASAFSLGGSALGMRTGNCTDLFGRHGSVSIPHSDSPSVARGSYMAPCLAFLGSTPRELDKWKALAGDWWEFTGSVQQDS